MAEVATLLAQADPRRAESIARNIPDNQWQAKALAKVAAAMAEFDPDRAVRLLNNAEQLARTISDNCDQALALTDVAAAYLDPDQRPTNAANVSQQLHAVTDDPAATGRKPPGQVAPPPLKRQDAGPRHLWVPPSSRVGIAVAAAGATLAVGVLLWNGPLLPNSTRGSSAGTGTSTTSGTLTNHPSPPETTNAPPTAVPGLTVWMSSVSCPRREIRITVTNSGTHASDFTVEQDGSVILADRVGGNSSRIDALAITDGKATTLSMIFAGQRIYSGTRTALCTSIRTPAAGASRPHTGQDRLALYAKIASAVAAMITGVIILWWGGIWPRRRERKQSETEPPFRNIREQP